jgi:hypothetical protein
MGTIIWWRTGLGYMTLTLSAKSLEDVADFNSYFLPFWILRFIPILIFYGSLCLSEVHEMVIETKRLSLSGVNGLFGVYDNCENVVCES